MELEDETVVSISKRQRFHGGEDKRVRTEMVVGIGRLPDSMLCHILSFLETKYAVQTSILSKQWRYLWTSAPCIDIQYPRDESFIDFGYRLLRLNTVSCLRKFSLSLRKDYEQLSEWIGVVLKRDIEEIDLNIWGKQCIKLPPTIFSCQKLVILKMKSKIHLDVPSSVYLPSLKILRLYLGKSFVEESMKKLLDGCPVIEELNILCGEDYNVKSLLVQSSLLKSLSIYCCYFGHSSDLRIVLDVPHVEQLSLTNFGNVQFDINNSLSYLVKLNINLTQFSRPVELLGKFTNTKCMVISLKSLECQPLDDFPIFHNLAHLELNSYSRTVLPALLECFPNLVTLVSYSICMGRSREEQQLHFKAPKCMMLYLEEIELNGINGFMHEMEMISYLLKNSMVLKKLTIQSISSSAEDHSKISKKLLTFPRRSPECQIIFDS